MTYPTIYFLWIKVQGNSERKNEGYAECNKIPDLLSALQFLPNFILLQTKNELESSHGKLRSFKRELLMGLLLFVN